MTDEVAGAPEEVTGPTPCFACGRALTQLEPGMARDTQPDDAVTFYAQGQYGSKVFDPLDDTTLAINVCDGCLTERASRVLHFGARLPAPPVLPSHWAPPPPGAPAHKPSMAIVEEVPGEMPAGEGGLLP